MDFQIALEPNNIAALPVLLDEVTQGVQALIGHGEVDRQELLIKCRSMIQAIETPRETMIKDCWAQVCNNLGEQNLRYIDFQDWNIRGY